MDVVNNADNLKPIYAMLVITYGILSRSGHILQKFGSTLVNLGLNILALLLWLFSIIFCLLSVGRICVALECGDITAFSIGFVVVACVLA